MGCTSSILTNDLRQASRKDITKEQKKLASEICEFEVNAFQWYITSDVVCDYDEEQLRRVQKLHQLNQELAARDKNIPFYGQKFTFEMPNSTKAQQK